MKIYTILDSKAGAFNLPFFQKTHGEAERNFNALVNDNKSLVSQYPEDFDLYYLGEYDDETGTFKSLDTPQHMLKAIACKKGELNS